VTYIKDEWLVKMMNAELVQEERDENSEKRYHDMYQFIT
jgi:hypothetical protein